MKTLCSKTYLDRLRYRLGFDFDFVFVVDPVGRSGGLALLWNVEDNLEVYNYSKQHINVISKDCQGHPF